MTVNDDTILSLRSMNFVFIQRSYKLGAEEYEEDNVDYILDEQQAEGEDEDSNNVYIYVPPRASIFRFFATS